MSLKKIRKEMPEYMGVTNQNNHRLHQELIMRSDPCSYNLLAEMSIASVNVMHSILAEKGKSKFFPSA
jgi:hypothetical protein